MNLTKQAVKKWRNDSLFAVIKRLPAAIYLLLWPYLPKSSRPIQFNEVTVDHYRITDSYLPSFITQYTNKPLPNHEPNYVPLLREHIHKGEEVVLIGGGIGVSTVVAARQVGSEGTVKTFEGSQSEVERTNRTVQLNNVIDRVQVHDAIIGEKIHIRGAEVDANRIDPKDLPSCDVLGIDADGAEFSILENLSIRPARIIVEHHPVPGDGESLDLDYNPDKIRDLLQDIDYEIVEESFRESHAFGQYPEIVIAAEDLSQPKPNH